MTDLDTLRRALQAPPATNLGGLHVGQIMARGRRVRRRRRILAGGGCAALAAAVAAAAVIGAGQLGKPAAPKPPSPITGGHSPHRGHNAPYGAVISTGIRTSAGELVFYAVHIRTAQLPGITFGVMAGDRKASGKLARLVEVNEAAGSDTSLGFHAVESPMVVNGQTVPEFGYYADPAAKITGTVSGRTIRASHARWSVNPRIVIFWFSPAADPMRRQVTGLAAYNANGHRLPSGNSTPGLG
jgi:hypothetical protein